MADPVLIAVVISCAHAASRVLDALAQRIVLRARRDLVQAAAALPPGTEVRERRHLAGAGRTSRQAGSQVSGPGPADPAALLGSQARQVKWCVSCEACGDRYRVDPLGFGDLYKSYASQLRRFVGRSPSKPKTHIEWIRDRVVAG